MELWCGGGFLLLGRNIICLRDENVNVFLGIRRIEVVWDVWRCGCSRGRGVGCDGRCGLSWGG